MSLAEQITDYLFTTGAGQKARRLVLELENGITSGGWAREPACDAIQRIIDADARQRDAALDLLDAARDALDALDMEDDADGYAGSKLRKAIAKATREE